MVMTLQAQQMRRPTVGRADGRPVTAPWPGASKPWPWRMVGSTWEKKQLPRPHPSCVVTPSATLYAAYPLVPPFLYRVSKRAAPTGRRSRQPKARSRLNAALMRPRWVKAWGKLPICSPVWPISSAYSPR